MQTAPHRQVVSFGEQIAAAQARRCRWSGVCVALLLCYVGWSEYGLRPWPATEFKGDWALAADGVTVAFTAPRERPAGLYTLRLDTHDVRQVAAPVPMAGPPEISPDGRWVLLARSLGKRTVGLWLSPLHGDRPGRWLWVTTSRQVRCYAWSADGRTVYLADVPWWSTPRRARSARLLAIDVASGAVRRIADTRDDPVAMHVEPDGEHVGHLVVYAWPDTVRSAATLFCLNPAGGPSHDPVSTPGAPEARTPDGQRELHLSRADAEHLRGTWRITDRAGRTVVGPFAVTGRWTRTYVRPDGRTLVSQVDPAEPVSTNVCPAQLRAAAASASERAAQHGHPVYLLHSDGAAERLFDDQLFENPWFWQTTVRRHAAALGD